MSIRKGKNSYSSCERFLINKLTELKTERKLKEFCEEHDLNYNTTSMFLNRKIEEVSPKFICNCLIAFGYHVKMTKEIFYEIS